MKRRALGVMALALMMMTLLLLCAPALCEAALPEDDAQPVYTWAYVGTTAGAAAAAALITQYTKEWLDRLRHVPTRLVVLLLCLLFMVGSRAAQGALALQDLPIVLLNAVIAATSAMGMYQVTFARLEDKNK